MPPRELPRETVKPTAKVTELIRIDDAKLKQLLRDDRFVRAFPCVSNGERQLRGLKTSCGRCARRVNNQRRRVYAALRNCLATLPVDKRRQLKQFLGAKKVRIVRKNAKGVNVQVTY